MIGTVNRWKPWVIVMGVRDDVSMVIRSCGEWLRYRTKQEAEEACLDWNTAFACYDGWQMARVVNEENL